MPEAKCLPGAVAGRALPSSVRMIPVGGAGFPCAAIPPSGGRHASSCRRRGVASRTSLSLPDISRLRPGLANGRGSGLYRRALARIDRRAADKDLIAAAAEAEHQLADANLIPGFGVSIPVVIKVLSSRPGAPDSSRVGRLTTRKSPSRCPSELAVASVVLVAPCMTVRTVLVPVFSRAGWRRGGSQQPAQQGEEPIQNASCQCLLLFASVLAS